MQNAIIGDQCLEYMNIIKDILFKKMYNESEIDNIMTKGSKCVLHIINTIEKEIKKEVEERDFKILFEKDMNDCKDNKITLKDFINRHKINIELSRSVINKTSRLQEIITTVKRNIIRSRMKMEPLPFVKKIVLNFKLDKCFDEFTVEYFKNKKYNFDVIQACMDKNINEIVKQSLDEINYIYTIEDEENMKLAVDLKNYLSKDFYIFKNIMLHRFNIEVNLEQFQLFDGINVLLETKAAADREYDEKYKQISQAIKIEMEELEELEKMKEIEDFESTNPKSLEELKELEEFKRHMEEIHMKSKDKLKIKFTKEQSDRFKKNAIKKHHK